MCNRILRLNFIAYFYFGHILTHVACYFFMIRILYYALFKSLNSILFIILVIVSDITCYVDCTHVACSSAPRHDLASFININPS